MNTFFFTKHTRTPNDRPMSRALAAARVGRSIHDVTTEHGALSASLTRVIWVPASTSSACQSPPLPPPPALVSARLLGETLRVWSRRAQGQPRPTASPQCRPPLRTVCCATRATNIGRRKRQTVLKLEEKKKSAHVVDVVEAVLLGKGEALMRGTKAIPGRDAPAGSRFNAEGKNVSQQFRTLNTDWPNATKLAGASALQEFGASVATPAFTPCTRTIGHFHWPSIFSWCTSSPLRLRKQLLQKTIGQPSVVQRMVTPAKLDLSARAFISRKRRQQEEETRCSRCPA